MIAFPCHICNTPLMAEEHQAGQLVRCPTCLTALRVPVAQKEAVGAGAGPAAKPPAPPAPPAPPRMGVARGAGTVPVAPPPAPTVAGGVRVPPNIGRMNANNTFRSVGKRYGFNCPYCSSRLEANESMAAQDGQCPTCGNTITIPILDRYGRLIDPKTRQIIKQDPHPVHAYAAAGDRAPVIKRGNAGQPIIICPRCSSTSPITANNCKACGMPFTMEGTTLEAGGSSNGFCVASLVLGVIGIPAACTVLPALLAVVFGVIGYLQVTREGAESSGKGMAIAGTICGVIGCGIAATIILR